ncbi:hypothetical protein ACFE04_025998 [Oxalis oulophora]
MAAANPPVSELESPKLKIAGKLQFLKTGSGTELDHHATNRCPATTPPHAISPLHAIPPPSRHPAAIPPPSRHPATTMPPHFILHLFFLIKSVEVVAKEKKKQAEKSVEREAVATDNEVNLADNDSSWAFPGNENVEQSTLPENLSGTGPEVATRAGEEVNSDGVNDERHEDELSDGYDNLSHEDSDEDDELQSARVKLRAS